MSDYDGVKRNWGDKGSKDDDYCSFLMFCCEMGVLAGQKHAISERLFSLVSGRIVLSDEIYISWSQEEIGGRRKF